MRYLTHTFAHPETLDRAHRWLVHAGVAPDRMLVTHHGVPRLAVAAEPSEVDGIEMVIHAAEMTDPDGLPSFWDLARLRPIKAAAAQTAAPGGSTARQSSFELAWCCHDADHDEAVKRDVELQRAYRELRG